MNLDKAIVADIETIGFLKKIKTFEDLHVMSCSYQDKEGKWKILSTNKFEDIQKMFGNPDNTIVMHNGISFDVPALEKMGIKVNATIIDTLGLSYYLYSEKKKHGLAEWGEFFGVPKPEIEDWEGLTYEEYKHRCEEDVKINTNLWIMILRYLRNLYDNDDELIKKTITYFNFKMKKLRLHEKNPIQIDVDQCIKNAEFLEGVVKEKEEELNALLPKVPKIAKRTKPKVCFKKDGSLSAHGEKWFSMLQKMGLPDDYEGSINEIVGYTEPNCQSSDQMKDYLFTLGWKPTILKDGTNGKVPQLRDDDKNLCKDIQRLIEENPSLQALDGLSVAQHRLGYLKGFLKAVDEEGRANAWASAFTRTLRLKHAAPFANLPKPKATHGALVRGVMTAPEGKVCIGADLSSIEDKCKQISIYPLDPEYVKSMNTPGWDAHLALGEKAGMFNADEVQFYKWYKNIDKAENEYTCPEVFTNLSDDEKKEKFVALDKKRAVAKTTNYACLPSDNTEVLTSEGWKTVEELSLDSKVLSYNASTNLAEFTNITYIHKYSDAEVFSLKNKWWSVESTANHRWLTDKRDRKNVKGSYKRGYTVTENINTEDNIVNSVPFKGGNLDITEDEASLIGWLLSDGSYSWSTYSDKTSTSKGSKRGLVCSIAQSSKKYYAELKELLLRMDIYKSEYTNNSGCEVFSLKKDMVRDLSKKLGFYGIEKHDFDWSSLILNMPIECIHSFFKSFYLADGQSKSRTKSYIFYQNEGKIKDALILAGYLLGFRVTEYFKEVTSSGKKHFVINFSVVNKTSGQRLKREFSRVTDVFCLTTDNSNFIIRQNGIITITGNCTYGAGAAKLAETTGMSLAECKKLHKGYHDLNWAVKKFAETRKVKTVKGTNWRVLHKKAGGLVQTEESTWIWNEFSKMWLFLKNDKDRFSACNQNFGVKVFDVWAYFLVEEGIEFSGEWHDEELWFCKDTPEEIEKHIRAIKRSIEKVNKYFNPPIPIEADYKVGKTYADVH